MINKARVCTMCIYYLENCSPCFSYCFYFVTNWSSKIGIRKEIREKKCNTKDDGGTTLETRREKK